MKLRQLFFPALLLLFSCDDLHFDKGIELPISVIGEPSNIDDKGVTLSAELYNYEDRDITASYFSWYPRYVTHFRNNARCRENVAMPEDGKISVRIEHDITEGIEYEYVFVIEKGNAKIYSEPGYFVGEGSVLDPFTLSEAVYPEGASSSDFILWGAGEIYRVGDVLNIFDTEAKQFRFQRTGTYEWLLNHLIGANDDILVSMGNKHNSSAEIAGIWFLEKDTTSFERQDDSDFGAGSVQFWFASGSRFYYAASDWKVRSFDTNNYAGQRQESEVPFIQDARKYHATSVDEDGYVFFSTPKREITDDLHEHEFWKFSVLEQQWSRLADYPGTGRDYFSIFTDNERYIYLGLGISGATNFFANTTIPQGDIWRYDTNTDRWEFIGWAPISDAFYIDNQGAKIKNTVHYIFYSNNGKLVVLELDPKKVADIPKL